MEDDDVHEDVRLLVDNLKAQEDMGIELELRNYRHALCRMYAHALGYKGKRVVLPVCVQSFVDKHFVEEGEERTGFKPK